MLFRGPILKAIGIMKKSNMKIAKILTIFKKKDLNV